jgi:hypothetical protein
MSRRKATTLEETWADRLGVDGLDDVRDELASRFECLSWFVLTGEMPRAGKPVSAEVATAYCDLWVLVGFLTDAKRLLNGEEVAR